METKLVMFYDRNRGIVQFLTEGSPHGDFIIHRRNIKSKIEVNNLMEAVRITDALALLMNVKWKPDFERRSEGLFRWTAEPMPVHEFDNNCKLVLVEGR